MFDTVELGEVGVRAFGFWLWIFSSKYRAQVGEEWQKAGAGRRAVMALEYLVSAVLGLGIPVLVWMLLT